MGNGIAHAFAQKNYEVTIVDISEESLSKAINTITKNLDRMLAKEKISNDDKLKTLANISTTTNFSSCFYFNRNAKKNNKNPSI